MQLKLLKTYSSDLMETMAVNNIDFNGVMVDIYYVTDNTRGFYIDLSLIYRVRVDGVIKDKKVIIHIKELAFEVPFSNDYYIIAKETAVKELEKAVKHFNNSLIGYYANKIELYKKNIAYHETATRNFDITQRQVLKNG